MSDFPDSSSALLVRALNAASNGIIITSSEGDLPIVYCNAAFEQLTGYPASEVLGRNCRFLQGEHTDAETRARLRNALCAGERVDVIILNYRRDGTPFWNALNLAPIHDPSGRVTHFVGIQTDVTERVEQQRRLEVQTQMDELTGLGNRASFMRALEDALPHSVAGSPIAVGFGDLDDFKQVNDTLGHETGDELLRQVAVRLRDCVRKVDMVARLSGDEFVLLLREVQDAAVVEAVAQRTLRALNEPFLLKGLYVRVSASLGFVLPTPGMSAEETLAAADRAMYEAKHQGKQTAVIRDYRDAPRE